MPNKIKLIVLEGHDRTGKGTLLESLKSCFSDFLVYNPISADDSGVNYKDKNEFKQWISKTIRKVIDDLYKMDRLNGTSRPIVMDRLFLTDNVFSDLFGREHVVENIFKREIHYNFDVTNYIMLWRTPSEYIKRVKSIGDKQDFSEEEIDEIKDLFIKYKGQNDIIKFIDNSDTKEDILDDFIYTFKCNTDNDIDINSVS